MREIDRLIKEAKGSSNKKLNNYATTFAKELIKINRRYSETKEGLVHFLQTKGCIWM